jgi:hypothetical protein
VRGVEGLYTDAAISTNNASIIVVNISLLYSQKNKEETYEHGEKVNGTHPCIASPRIQSNTKMD